MLAFKILKLVLFLAVAFSATLIIGLGIKKAIEYLETNPYASKTIIRNVLIASVIGHFYLYYLQSSIKFAVFSCAVQAFFISLYSEYPHMKASDWRFILGIIFTIFDHLFLSRSVLSLNINILNILVCYGIIWASPIIFLFSLSATDEIISFSTTKRQLSLGISNFIETIQNGNKSSNIEKEN